MRILNDKYIRLQVVITVLVLVVLILVSQLTVMQMAGNYKETMIAHDHAVAGYLSQSGVDNPQIIQAFTSKKTDTDKDTGMKLLAASGYENGMNSSLLPESEQFYQKYALTVLAFTIAFSLILLTICYQFMKRHDKQLHNAGAKIRDFMEGDTFLRLEDSMEGSLSQFFAAVNTMATSLTTHIEKEKHNREFLKDTISDISHQLKTPLAALQMYNEIIQDENTGNQVVEDFALKSQRELSRVENLIQNLLKLAKLDAGTIILEKGIHSLKDFLEQCLGPFITRAKLEDKLISIECDNDSVMCFDQIWLGEAVGNIVKNALDHTKACDQIKINCVETVVATEIIVKDNGTGIHSEDIHHIFKRFYRSRYSIDKQGVGIGLALSKSIMEKHGGTITVQSKLGSETSFYLIFPKLSN
jgi:signal transduction histidine kinase